MGIKQQYSEETEIRRRANDWGGPGLLVGSGQEGHPGRDGYEVCRDSSSPWLGIRNCSTISRTDKLISSWFELSWKLRQFRY